MFDDEKLPSINIFARILKDLISVFEFYRFMEVLNESSGIKNEWIILLICDSNIFYYLIWQLLEKWKIEQIWAPSLQYILLSVDDFCVAKALILAQHTHAGANLNQ